MKNRPPKVISVLRPKDKSLETYKTWIKGIASQLAMENSEIHWTEKEWVEKWKDYWQKREKISDESGPSNGSAKLVV